MKFLLNRLETLSNLCVTLGGILILTAALLVTGDVVFRKLMGLTIAGADELSGYAFGAATMLALSAAMLNRSNIRIDIGYQRFPKQLRAIADLLGLILFVSFIGLVATLGYGVVSDSYQFWSRSVTPLRTPLAIPQTLWFAGLCLAVVTGTVLILHVATLIAKRQWDEVQKIAGVKSVDEQIDEETHEPPPGSHPGQHPGGPMSVETRPSSSRKEGGV